MRNNIEISHEKRFSPTKLPRLEELLSKIDVGIWCKNGAGQEYLPSLILQNHFEDRRAILLVPQQEFRVEIFDALTITYFDTTSEKDIVYNDFNKRIVYRPTLTMTKNGRIQGYSAWTFYLLDSATGQM